MLSTMKTRLKYYENVIDNLLHNVELTKELRHQDVKAVIDKYVDSLDLSWVKPYNKVKSDDGLYRILEWRGRVILDNSVWQLSDIYRSFGHIACIQSMAFEAAIAMGFAFPHKDHYSSLEDKIAAYHIAKIYLQSNEDLTECFYDLKL